MGWRRLTFAIALLSGCTPPGETGDGGSRDAGDDAGWTIEPPEPPAPPALPVFTPCPPGWREVLPQSPDGVATCDPWPEGGPGACAADEAHFPGEPGCTRVGSSCPTGEWPEGLPAGRPTLHVRAGGLAGGDGSQAAPFGTLSEALGVASAGTIVALGKGTFDQAVVLPAGVTLWGACVAQTLVTSSVQSETAGTITAGGTGVEIRNLQVSGERPGLWVEGTGRNLHVEDVIVSGAQKYGVRVTGDAVLTGNTVVVRDTRPRLDGTYGRGLQADGGASLSMTRSLSERNRDIGIAGFHAGTSVTLNDVSVRDTEGWGLHLQQRATAKVSRGLFERNREFGIVLGHAGTRATLTDVVVRATRSRLNDGGAGRGLHLQEGATAEVTRGLFERNREFGIMVVHPGTGVTLTDVVVRDTQSRLSDGELGRGLHLQEGATAEVSRGLFEGNRDVGVLVAHAGTSLTLIDVVIRDSGSWGFELEEGATADVLRGLFERNREFGIIVFETGTSVTLTDVVVRDTESRLSDGAFGEGLYVLGGATTEVTRGVFERNREVGVAAFSPGTRLTMTQVVITDTRARACAVDTCRGFGAGIGVGSYGGALIDATRFVISHSALVGVQLAHGTDASGVRLGEAGQIDLHDGEVTGHPIGANMQAEGFDIRRLMDRVRYHDNGVNLDTSQQYVPGAVPELP